MQATLDAFTALILYDSELMGETIEHPTIFSAAFSPDGSRLVTGGSDGRYRVWEAKTGAELFSTFTATIWWDDRAAD